MTKMPLFIDQISASISPISELRLEQVDGLRPAAVLMPLLNEDGLWKLLYIHRANSGGVHSDQVSFPGGGMEPGDMNLIDTALRETEEEIGIPRKAVNVLGFLPSTISVTRYHVTPIVGIVDWPQRMILDEREVSGVFTIEVNWLANPNNWQEREVVLPIRGKTKSIFFDEYKGEVLWGLTARMTLNLFKQV